MGKVYVVVKAPAPDIRKTSNSVIMFEPMDTLANIMD